MIADRCHACGTKLASPRSIRRDNIMTALHDGLITRELAKHLWRESSRDCDEPFAHTCRPRPETR